MDDYIRLVGQVTEAAEDSEAFRQKQPSLSRVKIYNEYLEGLEGLEPGGFYDLVYLFHRQRKWGVKARVFDGETKGIFSTRAPARPSRIGITRVKLIRVEGSDLLVSGLDAMKGSPVIDIKPADLL